MYVYQICQQKLEEVMGKEDVLERRRVMERRRLYVKMRGILTGGRYRALLIMMKTSGG